MFKKMRESKPAQKTAAAIGKATSRKAPLWIKALRTLALTAAALVGLDQAVLPNLPGRALTEGETTMLREVFKDSVDYKKIRIHHSAPATQWMSMQGAEGITHKNRIVIRNNACQNDYSACTDDYFKYVLLHEAAHVWQGQNGLMPGMLKLAFQNYSKLLPRNSHHTHYEYTLTPDKPLTAFNVEQQAGIIADYHLYVKNGEQARVFLHASDHATFEAEKAAYEHTLRPFHQNPSRPHR